MMGRGRGAHRPGAAGGSVSGAACWFVEPQVLFSGATSTRKDVATAAGSCL